MEIKGLVNIVQLEDFTSDLKDNFSIEAIKELYNYYNRYNSPIEYNPNKIIREWVEYENVLEASRNLYGHSKTNKTPVKDIYYRIVTRFTTLKSINNCLETESLNAVNCLVTKNGIFLIRKDK